MRQPELNIKRERGFLLIVAILVLVVIAVAIAAMANMTSADIRSSSGHAQSEQAYFVAYSGLERASYRFGAGVACASLAETGITVGNGTFDISATAYRSSAANATVANATDQMVTVSDTSTYAPHGRARIRTAAFTAIEEIHYSGKTAFSFTGVTRGVAGTTAIAHTAETVYQDQCLVHATGRVGNSVRVLERALHDANSMMAYAKMAGTAAVLATPYYRLWSDSSAAWGAEVAANAPSANAIQHMDLKFARTRNEAILGTLTSTGALYIQIWDGFAWSTPTLIKTSSTGATRAFDIAYETQNDRAIIVYNTNTRNPGYRIWDGSTLSLEVLLSSAANLNATYPSPSGVGARQTWIALAAKPALNSNEIMMISTDTGDAVYGARWDGTRWSDMDGAAPARWDTPISNGTDREAVAVAYESVSGDALFVWASATNTFFRWRAWSGGAMSAPVGGTAVAFTATGTVGLWLRLASDPNSDQIMLGIEDAAASADLHTLLWSGTAWSGFTLHDATLEPGGNGAAGTDRVFDVVWETHPSQTGNAWVMWGDGTTVSMKKWSTGAWGGVTTTGQDTSFIQLLAHPVSGAVWGANYQNSTHVTRGLAEQHLTAGSGTWTNSAGAIWGGPTPAAIIMTRVVMGTRRPIVIDSVEIYP